MAGRWVGENRANLPFGSDSTLRSENRRLVEEPKSYFESISKSGADNAALKDIINKQTSIGLQPVLTSSAQLARQGKSGIEVVTDY
ncbi:MAG: hypothetical protein HRU25_05680 [Psychrobium sp.]|nr:hypothetical protein [Psychrobium sp.]